MMKIASKFFVLLTMLMLLFPSNAFALRLGVSAYEKTRSNSDPNNPIYRWTGVFSWNYVMSNPTIKYRHTSSIYLTYDAYRKYEIGWRWPYNENPHLFVAYREGPDKPYTRITNFPNFNNQKIYLDKNSNQPYYIVIDSATSGDVIFVWNNKEVYRRHALWPDAMAMTGSERQCDGVCETNSSYSSTCYNNAGGCTCNLSKTDCGWETNYSHFWGLTKRRHDFSWVNWENLQLYIDFDPEYYLHKISNTDHKVEK